MDSNYNKGEASFSWKVEEHLLSDSGRLMPLLRGSSVQISSYEDAVVQFVAHFSDSCVDTVFGAQRKCSAADRGIILLKARASFS